MIYYVLSTVHPDYAADVARLGGQPTLDPTGKLAVLKHEPVYPMPQSSVNIHEDRPTLAPVWWGDL